jgi:uncharacterized membrane protein YgaE (UPF0421/DUF939 family)
MTPNVRSLVAAAQPALLYGVAGGLAMFVGWLLHAGLGGLWIVITAVVVLQPTTALSAQASFDRLIGTSSGALVGGVIGAVLPTSPFSVGLAVFLAALLCAFPALKKNMHLASLTAAIVVLWPEGSSATTALHRFADTVIGIGVVFVVSLCARVLARRSPEAASR